MSSVDVTQLELWMQAESENQRLEFKEAKKHFSFDKLKEYCVAIANEGGTQLLDIDAYFALLSMPRPYGTLETLNQLRRDRLIDQDAGLYTIRRMGALLFARNLRDFPDCARKAARVVVYSSSSKLKTKLDREFTTGYASGFEELVAFIMEQLPQNEVIRGALRQHVSLVPDAVIRELVANALIHQDLSLSGMNVMIDIHPDRVEISNPAKPLMPVERFIDGYQSRNERLGDLMRRFGICEERSSGIDRVVSTVEAYQLPAPLFHETLNRTEVVVMAPPAVHRDESGGPDPCVLSALRVAVGAATVDDESDFAGSLRSLRRADRIGIPNHQPDHGSRPGEAGSECRKLEEVQEIYPLLGLILILA